MPGQQQSLPAPAVPHPPMPPLQILLYGGTAFWAACIAYQGIFAPAAAAAGGPAALAPGGWLLQTVVLAGALLFIFSKGAKFSLFKVGARSGCGAGSRGRGTGGTGRAGQGLCLHCAPSWRAPRCGRACGCLAAGAPAAAALA